jgi:uncharacterized protein YbbC (DUF1343 family)
MIRTGLDRLLSETSALEGRRYGLLSNTAARSASMEPIHLALLSQGAKEPVRLLAPEHGFYGIEQDMVASADQQDPWTGLSVVSLYGETVESLVADSAIFEDLDLLVIDLQDVGARYYTYAASAIWAASEALQQSCEVWILDRPNPLGGVLVEGNLPGEGLESFVGAFRLPVRHGLTLGEMARLEARRSRWPDGLRIWQLEGWSREMTWLDLDRPWVAPSPNLPSIEATFLYPGLCLVEGTELSEGRGTTRPFQLVGAPGVDPMALGDELRGRDIPGVRFVPTYFRPQYQKHAGEVCGGVEIRLVEPEAFRPYRCGIELLQAIKCVAPTQFNWRQQPYEFVSDHPAIDLLVGDSTFREAIDKGEAATEWIESWVAEETNFRQECKDILIYPGALDR